MKLHPTSCVLMTRLAMLLLLWTVSATATNVATNTKSLPGTDTREQIATNSQPLPGTDISFSVSSSVSPRDLCQFVPNQAACEVSADCRWCKNVNQLDTFCWANIGVCPAGCGAFVDIHAQCPMGCKSTCPAQYGQAEVRATCTRTCDCYSVQPSFCNVNAIGGQCTFCPLFQTCGPKARSCSCSAIPDKAECNKAYGGACQFSSGKCLNGNCFSSLIHSYTVQPYLLSGLAFWKDALLLLALNAFGPIVLLKFLQYRYKSMAVAELFLLQPLHYDIAGVLEVDGGGEDDASSESVVEPLHTQRERSPSREDSASSGSKSGDGSIRTTAWDENIHTTGPIAYCRMLLDGGNIGIGGRAASTAGGRTTHGGLTTDYFTSGILHSLGGLDEYSESKSRNLVTDPLMAPKTRKKQPPPRLDRQAVALLAYMKVQNIFFTQDTASFNATHGTKGSFSRNSVMTDGEQELNWLEDTVQRLRSQCKVQPAVWVASPSLTERVRLTVETFFGLTVLRFLLVMEVLTIAVYVFDALYLTHEYGIHTSVVKFLQLVSFRVANSGTIVTASLLFVKLSTLRIVKNHTLHPSAVLAITMETLRTSSHVRRTVAAYFLVCSPVIAQALIGCFMYPFIPIAAATLAFCAYRLGARCRNRPTLPFAMLQVLLEQQLPTLLLAVSLQSTFNYYLLWTNATYFDLTMPRDYFTIIELEYKSRTMECLKNILKKDFMDIKSSQIGQMWQTLAAVVPGL